MPHGKLTGFVEGATDLKTPGVYGGGSHPLFKTSFEFKIDRTTNELNVSVYSKDSSRDDEMVGYCTLNFKKVFFHGHTVPLTSYPLRQPSGNPGGKINISLKFKMRPSPNGHNAHAPVRYSPPPRVTHQIVGRQLLSLDWGYDCHEEDASEIENYKRTAAEQDRHHENYLNLPGTASGNYPETKPTFVRYGNPTKPRPQSPQTPSHARPSPRTEYNQPIPGKPQPQIIVKPQVQVQVHQRPSVFGEVAGEVANGLFEGVGGELANQFMGGVGEAVLGAIWNF